MAGHVLIEVMLVRKTDKAIGVSLTGDDDDPIIWIPSSKVFSMEVVHPDEEIYEIRIPEWIARREGMI